MGGTLEPSSSLTKKTITLAESTKQVPGCFTTDSRHKFSGASSSGGNPLLMSGINELNSFVPFFGEYERKHLELSFFFNIQYLAHHHVGVMMMPTGGEEEDHNKY